MESDELLDITQFLHAAASGDEGAINALVPLVYDEMHQLAHARLRKVGKGSALETSDLLHESWARLLQVAKLNFENRRHFFGAAALAMRNILIEQARRSSSLKRDSKRNEALPEEMPEFSSGITPQEAIDIGDLVDRLRVINPRCADVVMQRFYNGLPIKEVAEILDVAENTVGRDWKFAKAWLQEELGYVPDIGEPALSDREDGD